MLSTIDLIPFEEFFASRFFKEWVQPQGLIDSVFATVEKTATSYAFVAITRHQRHGIIDEATRRRMILLAPHLQRAVAISKAVDIHKSKAASLADTLDGVAAAMFLLGADGRILHANASAQIMLADGSPLKQAGGRLSSTDIAADRSLKEILKAAQNGDAAVGARGVAVPLRASHGEQFAAHVLPLTSGARRQAIRYSAVAAIFITKIALDLPHPLATLARVYKLTLGELRVHNRNSQPRRHSRPRASAWHFRDDGKDASPSRFRKNANQAAGRSSKARRRLRQPSTLTQHGDICVNRGVRLTVRTGRDRAQQTEGPAVFRFIWQQ